MTIKNLKTRVRTNEELKERKINFLKIVNILEKKKINFFIQGGVLLGARRENNFIKWDWDIEISLFAEDLIKNFELLKKKLIYADFKIINHNKTHFTPKIAFIKNNDKSTFYSLIGWKYNKISKSYTRRKFKIPEKFLINFSQIKFLDRKFNCPHPVDEYLKHQYGNWKKPLISQNKKEYLNKDFYNENDNIFHYKDIFINILKKFKL